jgi:hypothetical protein
MLVALPLLIPVFCVCCVDDESPCVHSRPCWHSDMLLALTSHLSHDPAPFLAACGKLTHFTLALASHFRLPFVLV